MARFGSDEDAILDRETHDRVSVLHQPDAALTMFDHYYSYEVIEGFKRDQRERIPRESFREAIANALAHRIWGVRAHVRVSMFPDRVEVVSLGGLPFGVTLPVLDVRPVLGGDEEKVLSAFSPGVLLSSSQVVALTGFGKDKALRALMGLVAKGLVRIQGSGRGTRDVMS